jgi:hypothetical protein
MTAREPTRRQPHDLRGTKRSGGCIRRFERLVLAEIVLFLAAAQDVPTAAGSPRPPPEQACRAWEDHIGILIEEHRRADRLSDEEFGRVLADYSDARSSCRAGSFDAAFTIYDRIPLEHLRPLR